MLNRITSVQECDANEAKLQFKCSAQKNHKHNLRFFLLVVPPSGGGGGS